MKIDVVNFEYKEISNINIIPSKGNLSRLINPSEVEYVWSDIYDENSFYPDNISYLIGLYCKRISLGI